MKIGFDLETGWFSGEHLRLIEISLLSFYKNMVYDIEVGVISITVLKFTVSLWIHLNKPINVLDR